MASLSQAGATPGRRKNEVRQGYDRASSSCFPKGGICVAGRPSLMTSAASALRRRPRFSGSKCGTGNTQTVGTMAVAQGCKYRRRHDRSRLPCWLPVQRQQGTIRLPLPVTDVCNGTLDVVRYLQSCAIIRIDDGEVLVVLEDLFEILFFGRCPGFQAGVELVVVMCVSASPSAETVAVSSEQQMNRREKPALTGCLTTA